MTRLLLDTHVFIWTALDPKRIARVLTVLENPETDVLVSAVVAWEIAIKYGLGRLPLPEPPASYVPTRMAAIAATPVAVTHDHALGVAELAPLHGDPFDRLLVAQAIATGATLVTADAILAEYPCQTLLT